MALQRPPWCAQGRVYMVCTTSPAAQRLEYCGYTTKSGHKGKGRRGLRRGGGTKKRGTLFFFGFLASSTLCLTIIAQQFRPLERSMKSRLTEIMVTDCPSDRAERKNERVSELASEAESGKAKSQFYSQLESPGTQVSRALETFWLHAGGRQQCAAIFPDCVHQAG